MFYLGNKSKQFIFNGITYIVHSGPPPKIIEGVQITSADGRVLTDANGVYITLKESDD